MRYLVIFTSLILLLVTSAFGMSETTYEEFIQSREVIATFYFEKNAETLTPDEIKRVSAAMSELKTIQESGRMLRVEGFSSPEGDRERNFELSFYRARSVADVLDSGALPSEVALTGYGDLQAGLFDTSKERRVEIASYITPVGLRKIKVAKKKMAPKLAVIPEERYDLLEYQDIDSYKVDQAIRRKVDDKAKSIAEQIKQIEEKLAPGISENKYFTTEEELERGYTQWRITVDPDYSPKVTKVVRRADLPQFSFSQLKDRLDKEAPKLGQAKDVEKDLQRGYSQLDDKAADNDPKLGRVKRVREEDLQRGYSQIGEEKSKDAPKLGRATEDSNIQRGYSQLDDKAADDDPKLGRVKRVEEEDLQRGYSQIDKEKAKDAPKLGRATEDSNIQRGYSQLDDKDSVDEPKLGRVKRVEEEELQRGYSLLDEEDSGETPKLGRVKEAGSDLEHGYSQLEEKPEKASEQLRQAKLQDNELQRNLTKWVESIEESREKSALLWPADTPLDVEDNTIDVTMILPDEYAPRIDALMIEQALMDKLGGAPTSSSGSITQLEVDKKELAVQ